MRSPGVVERMAEQYTATSNDGWGLAGSVVMGAALVAFAAMWALFVTAPPDGLVSPFGLVVSILAGGYLLYLVYSYVGVGVAR